MRLTGFFYRDISVAVTPYHRLTMVPEYRSRCSDARRDRYAAVHVMTPDETRQGKVVVAQHRSIHDPDLGGSYTIKVYRSEKKASADGEWTHTRITLKPDSTNSNYEDLEFGPDAAEGLSIVAELIDVL